MNSPLGTELAPEAALTLDAIETGIAVAEAKAEPDAQDTLERKDIEIEALRLRNRFAKAKIKSAKADRKMRKQYAGRILRYLEVYSAGVALLLLLSGFHLFGFSIESAVLSALVGSTAIAAIGLVGFIARGLFRPPEAERTS